MKLMRRPRLSFMLAIGLTTIFWMVLCPSNNNGKGLILFAYGEIAILLTLVVIFASSDLYWNRRLK